MCLELEVNTEQNSAYESRSVNLPNGHKTPKAILSHENMPLTDMIDTKVSKTASNTEDDDTGSLIIDEPVSAIPEDGRNMHNTHPSGHKTTVGEQYSNTKRSKESNGPAECKLCGKILSSTSSLERHMLVHTGKKPFKCELCPQAFSTNGNMHRHMRTHLGEKRKSVNGICVVMSKKRKVAMETLNNNATEKKTTVKRKVSFEKKDMNCEGVIEHKKQVYKTSDENNSQTFKCPVCNQRYLKEEYLEAHMLEHPDDMIECHLCKKVSENYACHKIHTCSVLQSCDIASQSHEIPKEKLYVYKDLIFVDFSSPLFPRVAKVACEEKQRYMKESNIDYTCKSCSKLFVCDRSLKLHIDTCKGEQSITNKNLTHESDKDYFFGKLELKRVEKRQCSSLPKPQQIVFKENRKLPKNSLEEVCIVDQGVPNIPKQVCNNTDFADIPETVSLASRASIPNIRSPIIGATASPENSESENSVSPTVEDSACSNSSTEIINDSDAQNRESNKIGNLSCDNNKISKKCLRMQNSARPYSCEQCSYLCSDKSTYVRHMRKHNGERPFRCKLCNFAFTTKANSCRHVQKKHRYSKEEAASMVEYNPNMAITNSTENIVNDNSKETVCKYCSENFNHSRVLKHHVRSTYCPSKPYACQVCETGCSTKNNCIRHITAKHPEYKDKAHELIIIRAKLSSQNLQSSEATVYQHSESNEYSTDASNVDDIDMENNENESPDTESYVVDLNNRQNNGDQDVRIIDDKDKHIPLDDNMDKEICVQHQLENTKSPYKETLSVQALEGMPLEASSEDDRVNVAVQSLVNLSKGMPLEETDIDYPSSNEAVIDFSVSEKEVFNDEPLDLTITAIDLSSYSTKNNTEQPDRQVKLSGRFESNSSTPVTETARPPPAHSSPVISVFPDYNSPLSSSNSSTCWKLHDTAYTHPHATYAFPMTGSFTHFQNELNSSLPVAPHQKEQPAPAHCNSIIPPASLSQIQTIGFHNNILIQKDQNKYLSPVPAHTIPVMFEAVEMMSKHSVTAQSVFQEKEVQGNSGCVSFTLSDKSVHPFQSVENVEKLCKDLQPVGPIIFNSASTNNDLYTADGLHSPVRNEINKQNVTTKKQIRCEYCSKTFTLKSNRDRHVKNIHPELAKPAHSRNSIAHKAGKDILKQAQNVSDKTKDLLRSVLIPKVSNEPKCDVDAEDSGDKLLSILKNGTLSEELSENSSTIIENDLQGQNSRSDFDLASVSSLINTANSNEIKKYLTNANVSDKFLLGKAESNSVIDLEEGSNAYGQLNGKIKDKFRCSQCKRTFPYKSSLQRHECSHTVVKTFTCPNCSTSCSTKSNLQRHLKNKCRMHILNSAQSFHEQAEKPMENAKNVELDAKIHIAQFHNLNEQCESSGNQGGTYTINNFPSALFSGSTSTSSSSRLEAISFVASMALQSMEVPTSNFECEFCKTTYKTEEDLTNHIKELHPSEYASVMREL